MRLNPKRLEVFLVFLIFGTIMGVVEDLLAIKFATTCPVTLKSVGIVVLIAIPFAFLGELVINRFDIVRAFRRIRNFVNPNFKN